MGFKSQLLVRIGLAAPALGYPSPHDERRGPIADLGRSWAVKQAFRTSWEGYYKNAFPHDTLHPISNTAEDDRLVLAQHSTQPFPWANRPRPEMGGV